MRPRGWFRFGMDPASLGTNVFNLLLVAVAIAGVGYVLVPSLSRIASVLLIGLFIVVGVLCVMMIVRAIQMIFSRWDSVRFAEARVLPPKDFLVRQRNLPSWWYRAPSFLRGLYVGGLIILLVGLGVVVALFKPYPGASHYSLRVLAFFGILLGLGFIVNRSRRK